MSDILEKKVSDFTYFTEHRIYKPNQKGTGAASKFQLKCRNGKYGQESQLFWVMAPQIGLEDGNAKFGWGDKTKEISIKLGEPDVAQILAVLSRLQDEAGQPGKGIFHKNKLGNTTLTFKKVVTDNGTYYAARLGKKNSGQDLIAVQHTFTLAEGNVIRLLLEEAIRFLYRWK